jgi:hypothetical protein
MEFPITSINEHKDNKEKMGRGVLKQRDVQKCSREVYSSRIAALSAEGVVMVPLSSYQFQSTSKDPV